MHNPLVIPFSWTEQGIDSSEYATDMDIQRAKELLAVLSDGVNPLTGEVLPEDDSCNQVEIVRALNTVLRFLDNQPQKSTKPSPIMPESPGQWKMKKPFAICSIKAAPKKIFAATSSVRPEQLRRDL